MFCHWGYITLQFVPALSLMDVFPMGSISPDSLYVEGKGKVIPITGLCGPEGG